MMWVPALVAMALFAGGCRGTFSPNAPVHLNPNMDNVTYLSAQEPSDFWADGRGMRPQVAGTVAVGGLRLDDHLYRGVVNGAWATSIPPQLLVDVRAPEGQDATVLLAQRGQERYEIYCTPCHGDAGLENGGIVARRGLDAASWSWAIPSLHASRPRSYSIGKLYDVVTNGINTMPSYASQIPVEDRWAIALYVRALQVSYGAPVNVIPADIRSAQGWNR